MFTHNQIIDSIQSGKKQIVSTFVTDAKFKEELNKLIDSQAQATKNAIDASLAISQAFVKNATEAMKKVTPAYTK